MGRKSSLSPEQWLEIERRHLVDGESVRSLAARYGVDESAIRRRINPQKSAGEKGAKSLRDLAQAKISAEKAVREISAEISALPVAKQMIVSDLAARLVSISEHVASAADYGAAISHRLMGIAHDKMTKIDDAEPLIGGANLLTLKDISILTDMANKSSSIAVNLLKANKETIDDLSKPPPGEDLPAMTVTFVDPPEKREENNA